MVLSLRLFVLNSSFHVLGQRDIVLTVKCEMFFLFAWDNNWEYMDLPIHTVLL